MIIPNHYHISPKAYELLLWHALHGFKPENDFQNRLYEVSKYSMVRINLTMSPKKL